MKNPLTGIAFDFAFDLAQIPESEGGWGGPRRMENFTEQNWRDFAAYVRRDTGGGLSAEDRELCSEIADTIDAELDANTEAA